jgi:hypothetical protein
LVQKGFLSKLGNERSHIAISFVFTGQLRRIWMRSTG